MSFMISPSQFTEHVAVIFRGTEPFELMTPFLVGQEADAGWYAYIPQEKNGGFNANYIMSQQISFTLKLGGVYQLSLQMVRQPSTVNDEPWFVIDGSANLQIYYAPPIGWVLISKDFIPGYVPNEFQGDENVWVGDDFFSAASIPDTMNQNDVTFNGRGTNLNESPAPTRIVSFYWPRYLADTYNPFTGESSPYGEYNGVEGSGAEGKRTLGIPVWRDAFSGRLFKRSLYRDSHLKFVYDAIHYDIVNNLWLMGTYGSPAGWHEGSEPTSQGGYFAFVQPEGGTVEGVNITLQFVGYTLGDSKKLVFVGETGVLR